MGARFRISSVVEQSDGRRWWYLDDIQEEDEVRPVGAMMSSWLEAMRRMATVADPEEQSGWRIDEWRLYSHNGNQEWHVTWQHLVCDPSGFTVFPEHHMSWHRKTIEDARRRNSGYACRCPERDRWKDSGFTDTSGIDPMCFMHGGIVSPAL